MSASHCCPFCGGPISYTSVEEQFNCEPCGKNFGDFLEPDELLCDQFVTYAEPGGA